MRITICGSMKFWDTMVSEAARLLEDNIVYLPVVTTSQQGVVSKLSTDRAEKNFWTSIEESHYKNIENSDAIYVINDTYGDNEYYIGPDTKREILSAERKNKLIFYYKKNPYNKYLYTVDRMNLLIPKDYYFNLPGLDTSGMYHLDKNDIYEVPLNRSIMDNIDMYSYKEYIKHDKRLRDLLDTDMLGVELGSPDSSEPISRISTIMLSNVIANVVAFTDTSVFIKLKKDAKSILGESDIRNSVMNPRVFTYNSNPPRKIAKIITWDLKVGSY